MVVVTFSYCNKTLFPLRFAWESCSEMKMMMITMVCRLNCLEAVQTRCGGGTWTNVVLCMAMECHVRLDGER